MCSYHVSLHCRLALCAVQGSKCETLQSKCCQREPADAVTQECLCNPPTYAKVIFSDKNLEVAESTCIVFPARFGRGPDDSSTYPQWVVLRI